MGSALILGHSNLTNGKCQIIPSCSPSCLVYLELPCEGCLCQRERPWAILYPPILMEKGDWEKPRGNQRPPKRWETACKKRQISTLYFFDWNSQIGHQFSFVYLSKLLESHSQKWNKLFCLLRLGYELWQKKLGGEQQCYNWRKGPQIIFAYLFLRRTVGTLQKQQK